MKPSEWIRLDRVLYLVMRVLLGGVFAYAGFAKLMEPAANFRGALAHYEIFPTAWLDPIAHGLPWAEWILGAFILVGYAPRLTALVLGILSFGFIGGLLASHQFWGTGSEYCGCFGQAGLKLTVRQMALLDFSNALIAMRFVFLKNHPLSLDSWLRSPRFASSR